MDEGKNSQLFAYNKAEKKMKPRERNWKTASHRGGPAGSYLHMRISQKRTLVGKDMWRVMGRTAVAGAAAAAEALNLSANAAN